MVDGVLVVASVAVVFTSFVFVVSAIFAGGVVVVSS